MTDGENFCLKNGAGSQAISQGEKQSEHVLETGYRSRLHKCNDFNANGLFSRYHFQFPEATEALNLMANFFNKKLDH
jgi:hypothetical protein